VKLPLSQVNVTEQEPSAVDNHKKCYTGEGSIQTYKIKSQNNPIIQQTNFFLHSQKIITIVRMVFSAIQEEISDLHK